MIKDLNLLVNSRLINEASLKLPNIDFKISLNNPTGNFFYDPWELKPEFKNTVWEKILSVLPGEVGEARLIKLDKGSCYIAHADIDDRWHINIISGKSYLVDLDSTKMYSLLPDRWYDMDAGIIHSAVNFGGEDRVQLVVRKLLKNSKLKSPINVEIISDISNNNWRYLFDNTYSPVLNRLNKEGKLANFKNLETSVRFVTEEGTTFPSHRCFGVKVWKS
jgi:hypothetical protein